MGLLSLAENLNPSTLAFKAGAIAVAVVVVTGAAYALYSHIEQKGYDRAVAEYDAKALKDQQDANEKTQAMQSKLNEAQNARNEAEKQLAATLAANTATVNSLRNQLAAANRNLSNYTRTTLIEYGSAVTDILNECSATIVELAAKADGHSNDARLLRDSWPKVIRANSFPSIPGTK